MPRQQLTGKIVSDKMQKTVVVEVERLKENIKYRKQYKIQKKFKAHDEKGEFKTGDVVVIEECKPISKDKTWKVIGKAQQK